jgi:hypothetical protein
MAWRQRDRRGVRDARTKNVFDVVVQVLHPSAVAALANAVLHDHL